MRKARKARRLKTSKNINKAYMDRFTMPGKEFMMTEKI